MPSPSLASGGGGGAEEGGQSNVAPQAAGAGNNAASDENNGHIGKEELLSQNQTINPYYDNEQHQKAMAAASAYRSMGGASMGYYNNGMANMSGIGMVTLGQMCHQAAAPAPVMSPLAVMMQQQQQQQLLQQQQQLQQQCLEQLQQQPQSRPIVHAYPKPKKRDRHGRPFCTAPSCTKYAQYPLVQGGVCISHGAKTRRPLCDYVGKHTFSGVTCQNIANRGGRCVSHGAIPEAFWDEPYDDPFADVKFTDEHLRSIPSECDLEFIKDLHRLRDKVKKQREQKLQSDYKFKSDLARGITELAEKQVEKFLNGNEQFREVQLSYNEKGARKWRYLPHDLFNFFVSIIKNALMDLFIGFDYGDLSSVLRTQIEQFVDECVHESVEVEESSDDCVEDSSDGSHPVFKLGTTAVEHRELCNFTYADVAFDRTSITYLDVFLDSQVRPSAERYTAIYGLVKYGGCCNENLPCNEIGATDESNAKTRLYFIFSKHKSLAMHKAMLDRWNKGARNPPLPPHGSSASEAAVDDTPVNEEESSIPPEEIEEEALGDLKPGARPPMSAEPSSDVQTPRRAFTTIDKDHDDKEDEEEEQRQQRQQEKEEEEEEEENSVGGKVSPTSIMDSYMITQNPTTSKQQISTAFDNEAAASKEKRAANSNEEKELNEESSDEEPSYSDVGGDFGGFDCNEQDGSDDNDQLSPERNGEDSITGKRKSSELNNDGKRGRSNQSNANGPSPKIYQPTVSRQQLSNPPENAENYKLMADAYAQNRQNALEDYEGRIIGKLLGRGVVSLDEVEASQSTIKVVAKGKVKDCEFVEQDLSQDDSILIESAILRKRSEN